MRRLLITALSLVALFTLIISGMPQQVRASSHREAPLIAKDPEADNTDLYAFVSPDKPETVTIVANYIPLQDPAGGPNFYNFGDDVLYEIHVSNDGTAADNITYQFRFKTEVRNPNTFLYNTGPIKSLDDPNWNVRQFYSVTWMDNRGHSRKLADRLPVPPVNIGPRSTPDYPSLAAAAVKEIDGGIKVFAGQRDDPFFVDLGSIFDLGGLRPFNKAHLLPLDTAPGVDNVRGYNVHSIVLQIPIKLLTSNGKTPTNAADPSAVLGFYASSSRQRVRVLRDDGTVANSGSYVQISRLGNPLVNEVIIPRGKKDLWNASEPQDDKNFQQYYEKPELARLINLLYPSLPDTPTTNRSDLVAVLLTGVPGLNFSGKRPADLLRLNVAIPPTQDPKRLGVLEGDFAGFPNGRRLSDDVVDIELRAVACGYGPILQQALKLCNLSPNNAIGDGVDANDKPFLASFPYVATPTGGYESVPHGAPNPMQTARAQ